jgi:hypothetical protein
LPVAPTLESHTRALCIALSLAPSPLPVVREVGSFNYHSIIIQLYAAQPALIGKCNSVLSLPVVREAVPMQQVVGELWVSFGLDLIGIEQGTRQVQ